MHYLAFIHAITCGLTLQVEGICAFFHFENSFDKGDNYSVSKTNFFWFARPKTIYRFAVFDKTESCSSYKMVRPTIIVLVLGGRNSITVFHILPWQVTCITRAAR